MAGKEAIGDQAQIVKTLLENKRLRSLILARNCSDRALVEIMTFLRTHCGDLLKGVNMKELMPPTPVKVEDTIKPYAISNTLTGWPQELVVIAKAVRDPLKTEQKFTSAVALGDRSVK